MATNTPRMPASSYTTTWDSSEEVDNLGLKPGSLVRVEELVGGLEASFEILGHSP